MFYLLGIDIGTQGTKAALFDQDMQIIASAFEKSNLITPRPGVVWQEPTEIYDSCLHTIREVLDKSKVEPSQIRGIGIDSQMAGIMGIDADGNAVTVYDSWLDTRCGKYMEEMKKTAGKEIIQITGGPVTYTHGPKILWWKRERPDTYERICKFVLPHAYVVGKMTGLKGKDAYFDYTCLQYSGFGDNVNKCWSDELLQIFDIDKSKMAGIVSPFEIVGYITQETAHVTGLKEGTPVAAGAGDTSASVFGSGMFDKNTMLDCAGTASVLCSIVDEFIPDTEYETMTMMRSPIDGLWMPLAYINGGGLCLRWFRDEFTGKEGASYDELSEKAKDLPPGSEGLLFIPHFAGRVLPNNPDLKGSFMGLDWKHTKEHLFRAIMEGISYEYHYYCSVLKKLYPREKFSILYTTGGGAKSQLFNSIKADVLGVDVISFEMSDTALIGSAVIAGMGCGIFSDYKKPIEKIKKESSRISFKKENTDLYQIYAQAYLQAIKAVAPVYKNQIFK
mgnify:CR=1 FL=1